MRRPIEKRGRSRRKKSDRILKRMRRDSRGQNTRNKVKFNEAIIVRESGNKRRRERENTQAGDNRAEPDVEKPESGEREAGSGLRPNRENMGLRKVDPKSKVVILFN